MGRPASYLALLILLAGCAAAPLRLGPGECMIVTERSQYVVIGADCDVRKVYR